MKWTLFRQAEPSLIRRDLQTVQDFSEHIALEVRLLSDATNGAVTIELPNGDNVDKDYFVVKIDGSANAVTLIPFGTQTINGASNWVLSSQYEFARLVWSSTTKEWIVCT
jgi:hypothetical protein